MKQTLIKNGYILSMNGKRQIFDGGDILVAGDTLKAIGKVPAEMISQDAEVVDAQGKIVMPGLINTHVHLSQQLGRGLGDDVPLLTWLHDRIWPYESSMDLEDSYISSLACCAELIRSGVTTFAEPGGQEVDGMGRAVEEIGIRGILARSTMDCGEGLPEKWVETTDEALEKQVAHIEQWHGKADGRIRVWFGLRTIFNCTDELMVRTKALADKYGVGIHMHVAEISEEVRFSEEHRGDTTVAHLANLGVLGPNLLAVHTVWMTPKEIDLFKLYDVKVSHNPGAAMRVLGFAPVREMIEHGIAVSIGTDGAPSNNRMDMFDEMYLTALIHKGRHLVPDALPAEKILEMATVDGARSLLWDDEIGSLEPGKKADLILVDPVSIGSLPLHDKVSNLVYAMHSSNVESVMCNGSWLMHEGKLTTIDEKALITRVRTRADALRKKAGITLPERFPVVKC